jgi:hypothetical protein
MPSGVAWNAVNAIAMHFLSALRSEIHSAMRERPFYSLHLVSEVENTPHRVAKSTPKTRYRTTHPGANDEKRPGCKQPVRQNFVPWLKSICFRWEKNLRSRGNLLRTSLS